jgi:lipopolysaccharide/colanic/teichoic acid biosynthesis glycosyltransferase
MDSGTCQRAAKRLLDVTVSGTLLLLSMPLLAVVWLLVCWRMGRPAIFRQQRPGWRARPFLLYKFRTMTEERGADGQLLPDGARLTALGTFLRRASIDELPQLWNVLRGDMSLVGPRPLLMEYLDCYTPEQARRHDVKPGITGWAQTHGRNAIAWEEKFTLDCWYVDHWSLLLDLRILAATVFRVLGRTGISAPRHATMPRLTAAQR